MINDAKDELAAEDSDEEVEMVELYNEFVEIDARASINGENIPDPKVYQEESENSKGEKVPAVK